MFRAIGTVLIMWYLSTLFAHTIQSADSALSASFHVLEVSARKSETMLK